MCQKLLTMKFHITLLGDQHTATVLTQITCLKKSLAPKNMILYVDAMGKPTATLARQLSTRA